MNTMKKEDMLKEKGQLIVEIGYLTLGILQPIVQLFGAVGRTVYLASKIEEATPKAAEQEAPVDAWKGIKFKVEDGGKSGD